MAELHSVHRYAAGALLALALHQAQIHQQFIPFPPDGCATEEQYQQIEAEHEEKRVTLWISPECGLLHPIFRYLKIDPKAWVGLEQTALSTDAKVHIGAFLKILSDDEDITSEDNNAEVRLAEAVDTVAQKFEEQSPAGKRSTEPSVSGNVTDTLQNSQEERSLCILTPPRTDVESDGGPESSWQDLQPINNEEQHTKDHRINTISEKADVNGSSETVSSMTAPINHSADLPLLREDYFGPSSSKTNTSVLDQCGTENECKDSRQEDSQLNRSGEPSGMCLAVAKTREEPSLKDGIVSEGKLLTKQRKLAVLYELLSAAVADLPPEKDQEKGRIRRGYDARQRVALRILATWLDVKWTKMGAMELLIAYAAMAAKEDREAGGDNKESASNSWRKWKRGGLIGAAALTGGALLALTGGLAAPAIAAGLSALAPTLGTIIPVIGSTGFAAAAAAAGSTVGSVAVAASFGAAGAGLTGSKMARRTGGVEEFGFEGIGENHQQGRLAVGIVVSGFINDREDFTKPWKGQDGDLERYALRWETKTLIAISTAIQDWLASSITRELMKQGAMLTVLSTLLTALAWPSALLSLTDFIDSKWTIAVDRSDKAGILLADVLLRGLQGDRPVTLIGFSLGARVVFKCLEKLADKGESGRIVERVVLLGAPLSIESQRWEKVRKVVAGRFVNAYSTNDWLLAVVYRASLMTQGLAGIQAVNVPGIENVDVTDLINGHSSYLSNLQEILQVIDIDSYFPVQL